MIYNCSDVSAALGTLSPSCCDSCHEDVEEWGESLIEYYRKGSDDIISVCCQVSNELDEVLGVEMGADDIPEEFWIKLEEAEKNA